MVCEHTEHRGRYMLFGPMVDTDYYPIIWFPVVGLLTLFAKIKKKGFNC